MATSKKIYQHLVDVVPTVAIPGHIYYVSNTFNTNLEHYVVDDNGVLRHVGGSGGSGNTQKENGSLIGLQNEINTEFTVINNFILNSTKVYLNGQRLLLGIQNDYKEVFPNKIKFNFAPFFTDQIIIDYRY